MLRRLSHERGWILLVMVAALVAVVATAAMAQEAAPAEQGGDTYTVQIADTPDTIAQRYNVSLVSLLTVNGLGLGDFIYPGDTLIIPSDGAPYGFYPGLSVGNTDGVDFYVVQPLDVLDLIAAYFNVDLHCLAEYNGIINAARIQPGFIVAIPPNCPEYTGMSSVPILPLRGIGLTGATVRFIQQQQTASPETTAEAPPQVPAETAEAVQPDQPPPTATPMLVQPPVEATATPAVIIQTPAGPGNVQRGPTVTPTPGG